MKISVIVPYKPGEIRLKRCLDSIQASIVRTSAEWEVVDVEGGDGIAKARNDGLCRATGDWIAWADADDEVVPEWAASIVSGIQAVGDGRNLIVFDARAEWDNRERAGYDLVYGRSAGFVDVHKFAKDVIGACRAGGWLWNKVFHRSLFAGRVFAGNAYQDYRMMCELLPTVEKVWNLKRKLYLYHRSATGISQFVNRENSRLALADLIRLANERHDEFSGDMRKGVTVQLADFCRHAGGEPAFRRFIRRHLLPTLLLPEVGWRTKAKLMLEAFK